MVLGRPECWRSKRRNGDFEVPRPKTTTMPTKHGKTQQDSMNPPYFPFSILGVEGNSSVSPVYLEKYSVSGQISLTKWEGRRAPNAAPIHQAAPHQIHSRVFGALGISRQWEITFSTAPAEGNKNCRSFKGKHD